MAGNILGRSFFVRGAVVATLLLLAGCATSRSELALSIPNPNGQDYADVGRSVVIGEVVDLRDFEESPRDPSIPSLGHGGVSQASDEIMARAVARKRNGYGKALGDVLLRDGQTVAGVIRASLTNALQGAGYRVVDESPGLEGDAPIFDVYIYEFWSWLNPGFWAISLNTKISTDVVVRSNGAQEGVNVQLQDRRQLATDSAWGEIIEEALLEYQEQSARVVARML